MRILVTDAQELAALGAIRSLGRARHQLVAGYATGQQRPASTVSRYCHSWCTHPDPWAAQDEFREWLLGHAGHWDLILPISEAAVLAAAACAARALPATRFVLPPAAALDYTLSKRRATALALATGLACPPTAFTLPEVSRLQAPYLVRTDNRLTSDGSYRKGRNWYLEDAAELDDLLAELDEAGEEWIAQQPILGEGMGVFLLTWRGEVLLEFAHERVHEVPFYGGVSSLRRSSHDPTAVGAAHRLLDSIGYQGVAMVEFRRARDTGSPVFIEINGRLWGSLALALHAGVDFPARLVACYQDEIVPAVALASASYRPGVYCRNVYPGEVDYLRSVLTARGPVRGVAPPGKAAAALEFLALFLAPRMHYDYLWLRDPLPWLWHGLRSAAHVLRSRWQRWRGRARQRAVLNEFVARSADGAVPDLHEVLFVCYGNICRGAFAARYWQQRRGASVGVRSAGFVRQENRRTPRRVVKLAQELGVDLKPHRSRFIDATAVNAATAIFVMDGQNIEDLLGAFPRARGKTWLLGPFKGARAIRDPFLLPDLEARASLQQIKDSIDALLRRQ